MPDSLENRSVSATVSASSAGSRLDRLLADAVPDMSRSRLQSLIRQGRVAGSSGPVTEPGHKVKAGETYRIDVPPPEPASPAAEEIALHVAYEDAHLIVIDKPAGLVVHPAPGHAGGTLVNALISHCGESLSGIGGVRRPGIVHRLDKDTSGLLVVAKSDAAHQGLAAQFAAHGADGRLDRAYLALCWGVPVPATGEIAAPIGRSPTQRTRMAVVSAGAGRHALTRYQVLDRFRNAEGKPIAALVRLVLATGRTHQIRVHLAHIGHPVLGDSVYGGGFKSSARTLSEAAQQALASLGRQALHAAELGFEHPITGRQLSFSSPLPPDIERLRVALSGSREPSASRATKPKRTTPARAPRFTKK